MIILKSLQTAAIQKEPTFQISEYLEDFDKQSQRGKCRACQKLVPWSRERLSGHKRASCPALNAEEKRKFAKISFESINAIIPVDKGQSKADNEILSDELNAKLANFFFRTGISHRLVDSGTFKDFVHSLNPLYAETMVNSKSLSKLLSDIDEVQFDGALIVKQYRLEVSF